MSNVESFKQFRVQPLGCSLRHTQAKACTLNYSNAFHIGRWTLDFGRLFELPFSYVREVPGDRRRGGHHGTYEMRAPAAALPALKVTIAC